jgi:hypothetical protein
MTLYNRISLYYVQPAKPTIRKLTYDPKNSDGKANQPAEMPIK